MRILLWLMPACLALTACNMAISDHPILSNEPRSALKLKDGLWVADDPECKFDSRRPAHRWPKCVAWLAIRDNTVVDSREPEPGALPMELVITDWQPPVLEFPFSDDDKKAKAYAYLAIEPDGSDSVGATDLRLWYVACGVEEPSNSIEPKIRHFPGMDEDCHPQSVEALRAAAQAGPQGQEKRKSRWRWIRAADR